MGMWTSHRLHQNQWKLSKFLFGFPAPTSYTDHSDRVSSAVNTSSLPPSILYWSILDVKLNREAWGVGQKSSWLPPATFPALNSQKTLLECHHCFGNNTPVLKSYPLVFVLLFDIHLIFPSFVGCQPDETAKIFNKSLLQFTRDTFSTSSVVPFNGCGFHKLWYDSFCEPNWIDSSNMRKGGDCDTLERALDQESGNLALHPFSTSLALGLGQVTIFLTCYRDCLLLIE